MATNAAAPPGNQPKGFLGAIERIGNKVPHPVILFLYLILFVALLSHVLHLVGVSVTQEIAVPVIADVEPYYLDSDLPVLEPQQAAQDDFTIETQTVSIRSLLTAEGIRFIFTSFVPNFAGFTVVAVILVAMLGVGVAEEAGMMAALIRKLVKVAPRRLMTFIIILVGVLTSVATDAGYLILIPLAATAFVALNRHPIVGIAAAFAGVSAVFAVNILIAPLDGMLTEVTNEAIQLVSPGTTISVTANWYFNTVSTVVMAIIATIITERIIEPRFGKWDPAEGAQHEGEATPAAAVAPEAEARGLRVALWAFLGVTVVILLLTLIPGAPLRRPPGDTGGSSPFLDSIIFIITLLFLAAGIGYGWGANTLKGSNAIIGAITKTFAAQSSLIFLLLIISQFIAHFNYTNMPQLAAIGMADLLERANIGAVPLLVALILVIVLLDLIIPNSIPKWAIFAPIFVPLFMQLGVEPQTVLAAYRVGDSPANVITPLMVYFPFIVLVAQRYDKNTGIGSIIALMLPYMVILLVAWILLFVLWFVLGLPLGPGYLP